MNKESRDRYLALADWGIQKLGFKDWEDGLQFASAVLDALAEKVRLINTREKLDAVLAGRPEPKVLDENITTAKALLYQFRERMVQFAKEQLPYPPGGYPPLIPANKHAEICESISILHGRAFSWATLFSASRNNKVLGAESLSAHGQSSEFGRAENVRVRADDNQAQTDRW